MEWSSSHKLDVFQLEAPKIDWTFSSKNSVAILVTSVLERRAATERGRVLMAGYARHRRRRQPPMIQPGVIAVCTVGDVLQKVAVIRSGHRTSTRPF